MSHETEAARARAERFAGTRVAFLGAGVMGETILSSVRSAGWPGSAVSVSEPRVQVAQRLREEYDVQVHASNSEAVKDADVVVVAVKPHQVGEVLDEVSNVVKPGAVLASVAAGLSTKWLEKHLHGEQPVVRVMPNTPALVGVGMSAISGGRFATDADLDLVEAVLEATGEVKRVAEKDQDAVVGVSGSGPAYVFYIADALIEAGVLHGLNREDARDMAVQTILGAATLLKETGDHPVVARERVSSPGGTTIAAVRELDERGVRAGIIAAATVAHDRSVQLGQALDS